ncbi:hypothetical protein D3C73_1003530 [compost metagenome]
MAGFGQRAEEAHQLIGVNTGPLGPFAKQLPGCPVIAQQEIHPALAQQQCLARMGSAEPLFCLVQRLQFLREQGSAISVRRDPVSPEQVITGGKIRLVSLAVTRFRQHLLPQIG